MRDRFSIESIPFFRTLYRRPAPAAFPNTFTLLQRSETLNAGKQLRLGDAQKRTSIKTQKPPEVKRIRRVDFYPFSWVAVNSTSVAR
jgi:hypothetical protein